MNLWIVYNILAIWRALESGTEGKKVSVLYIVAWNQERSVVVIEHFRNFKGI